jgi:hypothetical protein
MTIKRRIPAKLYTRYRSPAHAPPPQRCAFLSKRRGFCRLQVWQRLLYADELFIREDSLALNDVVRKSLFSLALTRGTSQWNDEGVENTHLRVICRG